MEKVDLILRLLEEFRDETNRRFDQVTKSFEEFRDETNRRFDQATQLFEGFRNEAMRRFEQIDKRFEQIDKRFEQIDKRMDRMEDILRSDREKLDEVYKARDKVKITFGWQWGLVSLLIAIVAAGIVGAIR